MGGDEFEKPKALRTLLRFGGKPVSPGDYAYISRIDRTLLGTFNSEVWHCLSARGLVFHVEAGRINILSAGSISNFRITGTADADLVMTDAAQVLADYANYSAGLAMVEILGTAAFGTDTGLLGAKTCNTSGPLQFTARL
jgi:hypothetical protein